MGWLTGRKTGQIKIETHLSRPDFTLAGLQNAIPINYGGAANDYSFYQMTAPEEVRTRNGDEFDYVWTGSDLTGMTFAPEDAKRIIKLFTDTDEIDGDGVDVANLTLQVWQTDNSAIDTAVNVTAKPIPIGTPDGERLARITIVNGLATKAFTSTKPGLWRFPGISKRYKNVRIENQIIIEVRDVSIWD